MSMNEQLTLIDQAIESARCRIYRLKQNPGESYAHQIKTENQIELMGITIKALEFYKKQLEQEGECMKIPEKVRISGVDYPIIYKEYLNDGTTLAYGYINYIENAIYLSSTENMNNSKKCTVLLHEILHGILHHYGTGITIENEELVIDTISKGLYQIIEDNKDMFAKEANHEHT